MALHVMFLNNNDNMIANDILYFHIQVVPVAESASLAGWSAKYSLRRASTPYSFNADATSSNVNVSLRSC